ncbi:pyruvate, phosphate dikinase [Conexibacter sp. W3-3-2]|uniref:pyruvate, phosphate dikinase n=1 Tax=Conexibacter sp. W3-3-2 TaxID=2675227 RepID=UPI0012B84430|nr:pyruvate, phosphate dikinase [Conexibacter sp. W3-3-2]MTD46384.1 pyruvate, phosphate dikinase [Conexibacter sp. W3-3-2]
MSRAGTHTVRRFIHTFESPVENPALLGGKGASLVRMRALGLPTPPGFTISTDGWRARREADADGIPAQIASELAECVSWLESDLGRRFEDPHDPLLVSVRSGAPVSMPGMMDTILNLGLSDETAAGLAAATEDETFAYTLFRRLLETFATVVRGIDGELVAAAAPKDLAPRDACARLQEAIAQHSGRPFPQRACEQLSEAIQAVWRSWDSRRAQRYRRYAGIPDDLGTAVTVQAMVFGTYPQESGTGVVFTRDPATGSPQAYGDYLARAQGEDVVAGGHDTEPLDTLRIEMPAVYADLEAALPRLEAAYRDMCDVEFTVERGTLWILQARAGQRSGAAAVRIAVDLVDEGLIAMEDAIDRVPVAAMTQLQAPVFAREQQLDVLGEGTPSSPGAAVGIAVFDTARATELADAGQKVVLIRPETSPEDIAGMISSVAIVTAVGGRTSHAAVVARGIGRPAVCGVKQLDVDPAAAVAHFDGRTIREGELVAVDGVAGIIAAGDVRLVPAQPGPRVARLLAWCDERRALPISAEIPDGYTTMGGPTDPVSERVLIDVDWEGPESSGVVTRTVTAALDGGASELALVLPEGLVEGDLRPAAGPWTQLVADPDSWSARLLAARLQPQEVPAYSEVSGGLRNVHKPA